ncbi:MAG: hypothetical protein ABGY41_01855, partial [Candidatus Poribacteria bacterium]
LNGCAWLACCAGDTAAGARLLSLELSSDDPGGSSAGRFLDPIDTVVARETERWVAFAREQLGERAWEDAREAGAGMSLEAAVQYIGEHIDEWGA